MSLVVAALLLQAIVVSNEVQLVPGTTGAGSHVSLDGDTAAVGNASSTTSVFVHTAGVWTLQATLSPTNFYASQGVALQSDWIVIGEGFDGLLGDADLWQRNGTSWTQTSGIDQPDHYPSHEEYYGWCVAVDGDTIAVGNPLYSFGPTIFVFERNPLNNAWRLQQYLHSPPGGLGTFAEGVGIDGSDMLISSKKSLYLFQYDTALADWTYSATLLTSLQTQSVVATERHPVSLADGVGVVGDPWDDTLGVNAGAAYIVAFDGVAWRQVAKVFSSSPSAGGGFGWSVSTSHGTVAVGEPFADAFFSNGGAVHLFARNGGWAPMASFVASNTAASHAFGTSVSLDGDRLLTGGGGHGYVFDLDYVDARVYCTAKPNSLGCLPAIGFAGTPSATSPTPFTISTSSVLNQRNGVFFYGLSGQASVPFQGGLRCVAAPVRRTDVHSSGGNALPPDDCSGVYSIDFNARIQSGVDPALVAGALVDVQCWGRDPGDPFGTTLSDALELTIAP